MKMDSKTYTTIGIGLASIIGGMLLGNIGSGNRTAPRPVPHPVPQRPVMPPSANSIKPPSLPQTQNKNNNQNGNNVKPPQVENQTKENNNTNTKQQQQSSSKEKTEKNQPAKVYHPVHHYVYHPVHHYVYHRHTEKHKEREHSSTNLSYIKKLSVVCKLNQNCKLTDGIKTYKPGDRIGKYYIKQIGLLSVELKTKDGKEVRVRLTE